MKHSTPKRSALPAYTSTPIISAVRRMYDEDDAKGFDPYNRAPWRPVDPVAPLTTPETRAAAGALLASSNSALTIQE